MDECKYFEMLGRKQAELDNLNVQYNTLLAALAAVASGVIPTEKVKVDQAARSWAIEQPIVEKEGT